MNRKYLFILITLICTTTILSSCSKGGGSGGGGGTPAPGTSNISIGSMVYSPSSVTVAKGTIVKWTNNDGTAHTATSNDGVTFNSNNIPAGSSYSYTTITTGTFNYHCTIHGVTMAGTLIVTP